MQTKIELLALDSENKFNRSYKLYEDLFSELSHEKVNFISLGSTKAFFITLSQKIKAADTIVLAVQRESFIKAKDMLFRSLKIQTDINSDVLSRVMSSESQELFVHSSMPVNSKSLLTKNGEYSGFIHTIGKKTIIFLPLDNRDCEEIAFELRSLYLPESIKKAEEPKKTETEIKEEKSLPAPKKEKKKDKAKKKKHEEIEEEIKDENDDKILKALMLPKTAIKKMKRDNISVAVASSRYSDFIFNTINEDSEVIYPFLEIDESEKAPSKKELASIASKARKQSDSTLGVSISNVFFSESNDNRYYIYICIADDEQAHILKFNSKKDEDAKDFLNYTVLSFFSVLGNFADTGIIAVPKKRLPMISEGKPLKKSSYKNTFFLMPLISAVMCIAILFCTNIYSSTQAVMAAKGEESTSFIAVNGTIESFLDDSDISLVPQELDEDDIQNVIDIEIPEETETLEDSSESKEEVTEKESSVSNDTKKEESSTVTTTKKETTTKKPVITLPNPTTPITTKPIPSVRTGALQFTVYGYGHGVGMSQRGMCEYARQGYSYSKILLHYYHSSDLKIKWDSNMPKTGTYNGKTYSIKDYIGKTVKREIGEGYPQEAIKAQVVAAYTYAKRYKFKTKTNNHAFDEKFDYHGTSIEVAMNAVLGQYLDYKGKPAFCPYFSTSAGRTTKCSNVWGGGDYSYLMGKRKSPEDPGKRVLTISTDEFKEMVRKYNLGVSNDKKIILQGDPTKWITILEHDGALSSNLGYIAKIKVGNQIMRGNQFRCNLVGQRTLRSHCFSYKFITK